MNDPPTSPGAELEADLARMDEPTQDVSVSVDGTRTTPSAVPDTSIRRYALLEKLGAGGVGVVYTAYDARLDRKVAIKVLQREESPQARARFKREAQALARLHHPNVVTVYDAGEIGERPFLAMELVDGASLREWLRAQPRGWREIVAVMAAAGRGLAAAHAAGLIHRDVKPDNILVGRDGWARMADFGLARLVDSEADDADDARAASSPTTSPPSAHSPTVTREGVAMGTPGYMAPERERDARSDQYSFCVAFWEALCGEASAATRTSAQARRGARERVLLEPPPGVQLPRWLVATVRRGLADDRKARWPSMTALVDELTRDRGLARRWPLIATGAAALAALAALAVAGVGRRAPTVAPCAGVATALDGVWDPAVASSVRAAFLATGRSYAADTYQRVAGRLDDYAHAWGAMRRDACEATAVRHEQSEALLDLRMACLDRRRGELSALTALFAGAATPATLDASVSTVQHLTSVADCGDRDAVISRGASFREPTDPVVRDQLVGLRARLDAALALSHAGQFHACEVIAGAVAGEARALGHPPLAAEAYQVAATCLSAAADPRTEAALQSALEAATAAHDQRLVATALVGLVTEIGPERARFAEADGVARAADSAVALAGDDPDLEAALLVARSRFPGVSPTDRVAKVERALALVRAAHTDDDFHTLNRLNALANALRAAERYDEGRARAEEALAMTRRLFGDSHPYVAGADITLALIISRQGHPDDAKQLLEQALAIQLASIGENAGDTATTLNNLAQIDYELHDVDAAEAAANRALAIREKIFGPDHPLVATVLQNLGVFAEHRGDHDRALALYRRAIAINATKLGPYDGHLLEERMSVAMLLDGQRRYAESLVELDQVQLAIDAKQASPSTTALNDALRADCELGLGHPERALPAAEAAVVLTPRPGGNADIAGRARWALARALAAQGKDRPRAHALAVEARATFAALGPAAAERRAAVDAWLKIH